MVIHRRQRGEMKIIVYNDSNVDWVVQGGEHLSMRFDITKFTMIRAWNHYIDIFEPDWE